MRITGIIVRIYPFLVTYHTITGTICALKFIKKFTD